MTQGPMNQLMKLILQNKDIISTIYFFDEVRDYYVQGVEIRLKDYNVKMNYLNLDDDHYRLDPFRRDIKGYVYIVIGFNSNYQKWLEMMIEGKIAQRICHKYPKILDGTLSDEDRVQMNLDEVEFKKEIISSIS